MFLKNYNLNSLEIFIVLMKAIACITGFGMIIGGVIGLPFMLNQYSYASKIVVLIICFSAGPFYLLPNSLLLKRRLITSFFVFAASAFIFLGLMEICAEIFNNRIALFDIFVRILACTSAPVSLYLYWLLRKKQRQVPSIKEE